MQYLSERTIGSGSIPGVEFTISRMSLGRRLDLIRRVRELGQRLEFHQAGESVADRIKGAVLAAEIDQLYYDWGMLRISGLEIDGEIASPKLLWSYGPEPLVHEIVQAIKHECGLSEEERKN
jgi:hypothetical protein